MSRRVVLLTLAAFAFLGASGCGARQYDVSGKVTYNGAPLDRPDGQITFIGPKGEQVMAMIGPDGIYTAVNVASGLNHVVVSYPNPKAKRDKKAKPKLGDPMWTQETIESPFLIPEKYGSADTSGLTVTVEGITTYDVPLGGPEIAR
jgi:hypothetical protein